MKDFIIKSVKKIIPKSLKSKFLSLVARVVSEQNNINFEIIHQKIASLEKLEYKISSIDLEIERCAQKLESLERIAYKSSDKLTTYNK